MKRQHPIRDLRIDLELASAPVSQERVIAHHVRPLLDALEGDHGMPLHGEGENCSVCRLLAEWRKPL